MNDDACEMKVAGAWKPGAIDDALSRQGQLMRCPECHGPMRARREGTTGQRAHFEHFRAHRGCPAKRTYSGRKSLHPDAID